MAAAVEVDAVQGASHRKATDEKGQRTPPPQPVAAARKHRQPTPDHPPYCWMIGEAIDMMGEDGGLEEDSISAFIRARYPGVPAAHDRLLRHYLDKHVAENFFVRTAAGRYEHASEDDTVVKHPMEQTTAGSSEPACFGSPMAESKCGRGRPRRDGSSSTSPAGKKVGSMGAGSTTSRHCVAAVAKNVPMALVAVEGMDGSPSTSKRRRLSRGAALLAAAVDFIPMSLAAVADKGRSQAASTMPNHHGKCRASARLAAAVDSVPTALVVAADKKDESRAASLKPKRCGLLKLGMSTTTDKSGGALIADKKNNREVPYTADKEHEPPRKLTLVTVGDSSASTSTVMDKARAEVPPTMPVDGGQPLELALVTTTDVPLPVPTPAMDKKDNGSAPSFNLAIVAKDDGFCTTPTVPEVSSQACVMALVASDHGSAPVVADKRGALEISPSATYKHVCQPRKAGSAPTEGKIAGSKVLSITPKGRRRQERKLVAAATGDPVAGKKAGRKVSSASPKLMPVVAGGCSPASAAGHDGIWPSVVLKSHGQPRKLYPVTAAEIPDDLACALLALPVQEPRSAKA